MRLQTAFLPTQYEFARSFQQIGEKTSVYGPSQCHDSPNETRNHQGDYELPGTNPSPDCGAELYVSHAHATHEGQTAKCQCTDSHSAQALRDAMPTTQPTGDGNSN